MKIVGNFEDHGRPNLGGWHQADTPGYERHTPTTIEDALWTEYEQIRERLYEIEETFQAEWEKQVHTPAPTKLSDYDLARRGELASSRELIDSERRANRARERSGG